MRKRPLTEQDANQLLDLGQIIRASRRGVLSLEDLAKRAGISAGQLSRVENGSSNPTIEILLRIADALGLRLTDLVEPPPAARTYVVKAGQRRTFRSPANPHALQLLTPTIRNDLSVTYCTEMPGEVRAAQQPVSGDVLYFVITGEIEIEKDGCRYPLHAGDALLVSFPHQIVVAGDTPAEHLAVFRPERD
ncbi:helix-turn-helix domain-containing protein [Mycobacterium sp. 48b]|uniref:helix-turn-helix domain-containing protein n=1 Tax=Mycobacterium sp. 48b TaxID=3400426 RepID=UPI003AAE339B